MARLKKSAFVLDFSRTVSRIGRGHPTGIDRVEYAYIEYFLSQPDPVFFLARYKGKSALLSRGAMREFIMRVQNNGPWDSLAKLRWLLRKDPTTGSKVRKTVSRLAISGFSLSRILKTNLPDGYTYINVGHARMTPRLWPFLGRNGANSIVVMVHDLIPIDFPQYSRKNPRIRFEKWIRSVAEHADVFIYNSADTAKRMAYWMEKWGLPQTEGHVVLLGTDPLPKQEISLKPPDSSPYFLCLGTIEPRKNHQLLLDTWEDFHRTLPDAEIPHLHIVGARGWLNEDVFSRLDSAAFMEKTVFEHTNVSDAELGALMQGARALLFPSFAEGFGYPLVEALQMKVPVIASELPCFREIAGDAATYINVENRPEWQRQIIAAASSDAAKLKLETNMPKLPTWDDHFHNIAIILGDIKRDN